MFQTEITIVGVGERREGVKDGKRWVCQQIAFTYHDDRIVGVNADKATIWNDDVDKRFIEPGVKLNVWLMFGRDNNGAYGLRKLAIVG